MIWGTNFNCQLNIELKEEDKRRKYLSSLEEQIPSEESIYPIYQHGESIEGCIVIKLKDPPFEHQGVQIELIGKIKYPDSNDFKEFFYQSEELSAPGIINKSLRKIEFSFKNGILPSENALGSLLNAEMEIRYYLKVTIKKLMSSIQREKILWINPLPKKDIDLPIITPKIIEIGIENFVRVEFYLQGTTFSLSGAIKGHILFHSLNLPISTAQLCLVQKTSKINNENIEYLTILKSQQILDGIPLIDIQLPFSFSLLDCLIINDIPCGGTMKEIGKQWSIKYYLQLVLIDIQKRHYYKQQQIDLVFIEEDTIHLEENISSEPLIYKIKTFT